MSLLNAIVFEQDLLTGWGEDATLWARVNAPRLFLTLIVAYILIRLLRSVTTRLEKYSESQAERTGLRAQQLRTLAGVIGSVGAIIIVFLAVMQILPLFGVDVKPILASAGIAGLAIGFGAQTLVKDVINGFFILLENQYDLGDVVRVSGVTGTVESMTLRKTVLRDANGTVHTIPNSEIKVVSNLTRDWAQITLNVEVDYSEPSDRIIGLLKAVGTEIFRDKKFADSFVSEPEVPGIERVRGHEVEYLMQAKVKPGEQWTIGRELRRRVKERLAAEQVRTAAPKAYVMDSPGSPQKTEVK